MPLQSTGFVLLFKDHTATAIDHMTTAISLLYLILDRAHQMCARVSRPTFADADTASDPFWETLEIVS